MTGSFRSLFIVLLVAGVVLVADQLSKQWVLSNIPLYGALALVPALGSYFRIVHTTNTGIAFGLFRGGSLIFIAVSSIAVVAIAIYAFKQKSASGWMLVALGLMLGGATGNLIDRLRYSGQVVDFLEFRLYDQLYFPTFNIADSCIVCGVLLLVWLLYRQERHGAALISNT